MLLLAFEPPMAQELIRDGKLDRQAAAEALRHFLESIVRISELELKVSVRALSPSGKPRADPTYRA